MYFVVAANKLFNPEPSPYEKRKIAAKERKRAKEQKPKKD